MKLIIMEHFTKICLFSNIIGSFCLIFIVELQFGYFFPIFYFFLVLCIRLGGGAAGLLLLGGDLAAARCHRWGDGRFRQWGGY